MQDSPFTGVLELIVPGRREQRRSIGRLCGKEPKLLEMTTAFFGPDRVLFDSGAPMDASAGQSFTADAVRSVQAMAVPEEDKTKIFRGSALRLLKPDLEFGGVDQRADVSGGELHGSGSVQGGR